MESGSYTDLAASVFLGLSLVLCVGLLLDATMRWLFARSLWAQVIAREELAEQGAWSPVKVWTGKHRLLSRPVYALMYSDDTNIRIESRQPINGQLITTLNRASCASHWRNDCVEFKVDQSDIQIKAVGTGLPVSSILQTDAFWQRLQPDSADPFDNGVRQISSWADRRSKLALLMLGVIGLLVLIETSFLNTFWLISSEPFNKLWWIPVIAAMPVVICMLRDGVPPVETAATALILTVGVAIGGHLGLKRVDQWISDPVSQLYVLQVNGERELVAVNTARPNIALGLVSPLWKDIALGTQHAVLVHGGELGTAQINYDELLPSTQRAALTD